MQDDSNVVVNDVVGINHAGYQGVWKGTVVQPGGGIPAGEVVFKIAALQRDREALQVELNFYNNQLKSLQGQCVPHCYGLFEGESIDERQNFVCLVLEYAGDSVAGCKDNGFFDELDWEKR